MKNLIIGILIAALLVGGIAGASALYKNLSEQYDDQGQGGFIDVTPNGNGNISQRPEESTTDEAVTEESITEESTTEEYVTDESVTEESSTDESVTEESVTEEPTTENSTTEETTIEETTEKAEIEFLASDFTMYDENGNAVKLSDFAGKPIVLNFWGTWCPYCKMEMPDFNEAYKNNPDVQFIMLNCGDTTTKAMNYVNEQGFEFPIFFDVTEEAQYTYAVYSFPTTYFITADGGKIYKVSRAIDYETIEYGISLIK